MYYVKLTYRAKTNLGTYDLHFTGRSHFVFLARIYAKRHASLYQRNARRLKETFSHSLVGESISRD